MLSKLRIDIDAVGHATVTDVGSGKAATRNSEMHAAR